jgi:hypothetical protein
VLALREVDRAIRDERFDDATTALARYRERMDAAVTAMNEAKAWSLFDPQVHDAHFAAIRGLYDAAGHP